MRSLDWKILILIGFMTTVVGLGSESTADSSSKGVRCRNVPCAYYENGKPYPGRCGNKKGDNEHCYCFKDVDENDKKDPSQTESEEDSRPCQLQSGCGGKQQSRTK